MRFNANRLAVLAGISPKGTGLISEAGNRSKREEGHDEGYDWYERDLNEGKEKDEDEDEMNEMEEMEEMEEMDDEQVVEVDEAELVSEIRRFRKQQIEEAALKRIIDEEVANVLNDMNLNSGWMYGNKKPSRSRRGSVSKGFRGIGFK